jgi:L-ascorbate metabolism protein UlaG (beta-lactamase superfamily)
MSQKSGGNGLRIKWLGHASLHIETPAGTSILVDPWFEGNPKHPAGSAPAKVDLLLVTHGHGDHTGSVVGEAKKTKAQVVGMVELTTILGEQGVENAVGMNVGGSYRATDVTVTMTEARHSSSIQHKGQTVYAGDPAGFVLEIEGAPTIYIAGDTAVFSDMKLISELYRPEIVILPIGDHYTMGPRQAGLAASFLVPKTILPVHWGTFPALSGTPEQLREELKVRGVPAEVVAWQPGETYSA